MNERALVFGEFRLIPARRELWRSDRLLAVQPKVLDTLTYLVQHRDRAVGRDELIAAVWGRADITDNVLSQIVGRARQTVGDSGEAQHAIRTVPRFGYRWIREVEASCVASAERRVDAGAEDGAGAGGGDAAQWTDGYRAGLPGSPVRTGAHAVWRRPASALALVCVAGLAGWAMAGFIVSGREDAAAARIAEPSDAPAAAERLARIRAALSSDRLDRARVLLGEMTDQDRVVPAVRHEEAVLALKEGRAEEALAAFTTLLADLGDGGDRLVLGKALYGAGQAEGRRGRAEAARAYYERAFETLEATAGPEATVVRGRAATSLGALLSSDRAFDEAERVYAKARIALEAAGDPAALAQLESNIGVMLIGRYRHAEALARFESAADWARAANDVAVEARARMNLVNAHLALLEPAAALASDARLRELRERVGDPWLAAHVDLVRAKALTANGRLGAAELALRAHAGRPKPADPALAAGRDLAAADLAFARAAWDEGSGHVRSALASAWYAASSGVAAYARWRLLAARLALGDQAGLAEAAAAADAQSRARPGEPTIRLYALLARGEAAAAKGDLSGARAAFGRALQQAETTGVPFDLVQVAAGYARFLLRHGEAAEARVLADRVAAWAERDYHAALVQLGVYHAIGSAQWRPALARALRLAGERVIPATLTTPPAERGEPADRTLMASR